jgi:hypothetical protein
MTTSQIQKTLYNYTKGLPKDALQEVLDFVQFIRQRTLKYSGKPSKKKPSLSFSQTIHLEEEFKNYKSHYPSE